MSPWLLSAACLMTLTAVVHSALGEHLIFRRLRGPGWIPTHGGGLLRERHVRILWATWHLVTVLGICTAVILWKLAQAAPLVPPLHVVILAIAAASAACALLVLVGTRGRHPGWVSLSLVSALSFAGAYST